jgi:hypothetical protein
MCVYISVCVCVCVLFCIDVITLTTPHTSRVTTPRPRRSAIKRSIGFSKQSIGLRHDTECALLLAISRCYAFINSGSKASSRQQISIKQQHAYSGSSSEKRAAVFTGRQTADTRQHIASKQIAAILDLFIRVDDMQLS